MHSLPPMAPRYLLEPLGSLWIEGPDACGFLNRLLTLKVSALSPGEGSPAHLLDSTGKLAASLYLLRLSEDRWLGLPRTLSAAELGERLELYHFGERLTFKPSDELRGLRVICDRQDAPRALESLSASAAHSEGWTLEPVAAGERGWRALMGAPEGQMLWRAARWSRGTELIELELRAQGAALSAAAERLEAQGFSALSPEEAEALRLRLGAPGAAELLPSYTPLDVEGTRALVSVSEGKGCYPGQETIERTLALGQPARALVHLRLEGSGGAPEELSAGHKLWSDEEEPRELGQLSSISPPLPGEPRYALAMVKRKAQALSRLKSEGGQVFIVLSSDEPEAER